MPPDNVIKVVPAAETPVNADVIVKLEEALQYARAGEVVAVGIATVFYDGGTAIAWSKHDKAALLIGAVARLQHELIDDLI